MRDHVTPQRHVMVGAGLVPAREQPRGFATGQPQGLPLPVFLSAVFAVNVITDYGRFAKNARTASAVFGPTTAASSSRVARRTPARLPNVVSSVLRRRGPMPGTWSSSDRRSRMVRARR